jgi:hypothetical protein
MYRFRKSGSSNPMAPAKECLQYPSILRLYQLLQEVYRGIFTHYLPAYQTTQGGQ